MSIIEVTLLIIVAAGCFLIGKMYAMHSLATTDIKNIDINDPRIGDFFLEKLDSTYYAYVGQKFVGQSESLDDLIHNMKDFHKVTTFKLTTINGLSQDEYNAVVQSIEKWYNGV